MITNHTDWKQSKRSCFTTKGQVLLILLLWATCASFVSYRVDGSGPVLVSIKVIIVLFPTIGLFSFSILMHRYRVYNRGNSNSQSNLSQSEEVGPIMPFNSSNITVIENPLDMNGVQTISRKQSLPEYESPPAYHEAV